MIVVRSNRQPVEVSLKPPFNGVKLTLKSLASHDFSAAAMATAAFVRDDEAVETLMIAHDLLPDGGIEEWRAMAKEDWPRCAAALCGIGQWIGTIETAVRAVTAWSGITDEHGAPVPVSRETLQAMLLNEDFADQATLEIDRVAQISLRPSEVVAE